MNKLYSLILSFCVTSSAFAGDVYVSPTGSDKNPGVSERPVASLRQALKIVREWRRFNDNRINGGVVVHLADGIYPLEDALYLRPEDSGSPESPTIIRSENPRKAVLSGGVSLKGRLGEKGDRVIYSSVLDNHTTLHPRTLWRNGKKALRASMLKEGEMERLIAFNKDSETITIPSATLLKYIDIKDINSRPLEMIVHQRWAIAILRIKHIEIVGDKAVVTFLNPESHAEFSHPWPQPVINGEKGSSSYALVNSPEFLDENGEWFCYPDGKLVVYGADANAEVVAPRLSQIMLIEGSAVDPVHDVKFEGISFMYSEWKRPADYGHVTLQGGFPLIDAYKLIENEGLPWAPSLENQAWVLRPEAAVSVRWAHNVDFENCYFAHLASTGLDYEVGCRDISLVGNSFEDIGGTALLCGSFSEGSTEVHKPYTVFPESAYCERFNIYNNVVKDAANEDWGCVGIGCGFVRDFSIVGNDVSHVNYSGIAVGWGWTPQLSGMRNNHIDNNIVHDFARQLYDAGGIYTLSNQPNSTIHNNTIDDLHPAPYATNDRAFYIYFDAETNGFHVGGNKMPEKKYGYNNPGKDLIIED